LKYWIRYALKSTIFWHIKPCSQLKVNRRFGETYRLHLQGRINRAKYRRESRWQADSTLDNHYCDNLKSYIRYNLLIQINSSILLPNKTAAGSNYRFNTMKVRKLEETIHCCGTNTYVQDILLYSKHSTSEIL
jgi:hypothetical protein